MSIPDPEQVGSRRISLTWGNEEGSADLKSEQIGTELGAPYLFRLSHKSLNRFWSLSNAKTCPLEPK